MDGGKSVHSAAANSLKHWCADKENNTPVETHSHTRAFVCRRDAALDVRTAVRLPDYCR